MIKHSDLTFITNEKDQNLLERFKVLIKDTEFFDVLVGYFYTTGFHALYKSLENTKRVRILIGISTNKETMDLIEQAKQSEFQFSHAEAKEHFSKKLIQEMDTSEDNLQIQEGVIKFIEWLRNGKLEIKAYPSENIHAKLYIMSFPEDDRDKGRVITGSSNFTQSGLIDNLEFNVELKNPSDYEFAQNKFNTLWEDAVDLKEKFIQTIQKDTWLNDTITPYQLYLKFLYEYFKDELSQTDKISSLYVPDGFKKLEYQEQAVLNAKKILNEYGGVFLSDVVGLGKTYMSAMLAGQLDGRSLVLAPPILLEKTTPGSWPNVFSDFHVPADFESLGKLDHIISRGTEKYKNVFIDEAHRFRTETNITYEKLAQICRGKRVVLVTATPLNNSPLDILSQIKLFQNVRKSTIPNMSNLEVFFKKLEKKTKDLNKQEDYSEYIKIAKQNSKKIRDSVLKYLMVRRTRTEIESYFSEDLKNQNLKFPEVKNPEPLFYQFSEKENTVFEQTVRLIAKQLKYARYQPLIYYKKKNLLDQSDIQSQKNLGVFIKILIIKRLESSFYAFKKSIHRFINSYELFLKELKAGNVYVSKKHANKIFELLNEGNEVAVYKLLAEDKAKKYPAEDFTEDLEKDLKSDIEVLREIESLWGDIKCDPKLLTFVSALLPPPNLVRKRGNVVVRRPLKQNVIQETLNSFILSKSKKLIVFTESKETAEYLGEELNKKFPNEVLVFTGSSSHLIRESIIQNFDPKAYNSKNDCKILITTDVLSEGVNLHRSNVVINYDIPWNPTRLMQRVGRINRVDTDFSEIHTFNFFPTKQSNNIIKLKETAEIKIQNFISLLGADARLLTEGEVIESHKLFGLLVSKKAITGEDEEEESELKYLKVIKDIRNTDPNLFEKIKQLPKKARTVRKSDVVGILDSSSANQQGDWLLTYFRKGKLQKFFITGGEGFAKELDFIHSARLLTATRNTKREKWPGDFYDKLQQNKNMFISITSKEEQEDVTPQRRGRDSSVQLLKILKAIKTDLRQCTDEQEDYLKKVTQRIEEGALPKQTVKTVLKAIEKEIKKAHNLSALTILGLLQKNIPDELLKSHIVESSAITTGPREVILSEYLIGK